MFADVYFRFSVELDPDFRPEIHSQGVEDITT